MKKRNCRTTMPAAPLGADGAAVQLHRRRLSLAVALALTAGASMAVHADTNTALPTGGQVTAGAASVNQPSADALLIKQTTDKLAMSWQSFNIGAGNSVRFDQPSANSIALNRVLGGNRSEIYGNLSANGQVFLVNPNGVLFGRGAQVDVGGLVASALNITDRDFFDGKFVFSDPSNRASVVNQGTLNAGNGGYLALIGHHVDNQGTMRAHLGSVVLGAGGSAQLALDDNKLVKFEITQNALNALVENGGLIRANGGQVILTAGARDSLLASTVNNTGVIEARTVERQAGNILLLAGMEAGTTHVGGTLDASAPNGGDGGFIETSGAHVQVAQGARITTAAPRGKTGKWLIDPQDFTIGSDITGTDLSNLLSLNNIEVQSSSGGTSGNGDINVNDVISWSANQLTLTAARDININAVMTASGTSSLVLNTGTANGGDAGVASGTVKVGLNAGNTGFTGRVDFDRSGPGFLTINGLAYTVIRDVDDLQAMSANLAGRYALGAQIDASATAGWNAGAGFAPIGTFSGRFDGLGHTITGLTIDRPSATQVGLFGSANGATLRNVGLAGGEVIGVREVGALVGRGGGNTLHNILSSTPVTGGIAGGVAGTLATSTLTDVHATGSVSKPASSGAERGGLIGNSESNILARVSAAGDLLGIGSSTGGLIGVSSLDTITDASASGDLLEAGFRQGGLIGLAQDTTIANSHATGNVGSAGSTQSQRGGLVGEMDGGSIANSYATGNVSGGSSTGGLVGSNSATLDDVYATGNVTGNADILNFSAIGGLVGTNSATVTNAHATGAVTADGGATWFASGVGGLIGINSGSVSDAYAIGNVTASGTNAVAIVSPPVPALTPSEKVGGLIGDNTGALTNVRASGNVSNSGNYTGGLVGYNDGGAITGSGGTPVQAQGSVTGGLSWVGGAIGYNQHANLTYVSASGSATSTGSASPDGQLVGGLVGEHKGGTIDHGTASGDVQARTLVGGLVGRLEADPATSGALANNIFDSTASGSVTVTAASGVGRAGGLVGQVSSAQAIQDVEATGDVVGSNVVGGNTSLIGGLIGDLGSGTPLVRAVARGAVSGSQIVGGLVGRNVFSTITDSHAHGNVTATAAGDAGGLVGENGSDITRSYAEGTVTATAGSSVGGLIGSHDTGTLTEVYAIGKATGASDVGGLVGNSSGNIIDSYATGGATATVSNAGGLVGNSASGGSIARTYAAGAVSAPTGAGGLAGVDAGATVVSSYWDIQTSGQSTSAIGTGKTTAEMKQMVTFGGWSIARTGGSSAVWRIYDGNTAPLLRSYLTPLTLADAPDATATYNGATQSGGTTANGSVLGAAAGGRNAGFYNGYYSTQQGYDITGGNLTIDPASLVLSTSNVTKTYDGTTAASGALVVTSSTQLFSTDSVSGGSFTFTDKNAGVGNKTVTVSGATVNDGNGGANYNVSYADNTTSTITPAAVTASGIVAINKVYDGTTAATLDASVASALSGAIGGDDVSLPVSGMTGTFSDKNVGVGKTVSLTGVALTGTDAGNYTLTSVAAVTADITPKALAVSGITAANKVYDGTTSATVSTAGASYAGLLAGDAVTVNATGTFGDKNVSSGKTVTLSSTYSGMDVGNYAITDQASATANIAPKAATVTAADASKTYGSTYNFAGTEFTATGLVAGETIGSVILSSAGTAAGAPVAGSPYAISASGANGGSFDPANYALSYVDGSLSVNRAPLAVTANALSKPFDGIAFGGGNGVTYAGFVNGEDASALTGALAYGGSSQGAVNPGTYAITPGGLSAANYTIGYVDGVLVINGAVSDPTVANPPAMQAAILSAQQIDSTLDVSGEGSRGINFIIAGAGINLPQGVE